MGEFEHLVLLAALRLGPEAYGVSYLFSYSKSPAGHNAVRGLHFQQWAWVDSNYRPHAYRAPS